MVICTVCNESVNQYADKRKCRKCYNAYMASYMLARYHLRRKKAITDLGGKCTACNSVENLEFDHIDPTTKTGDTGKLFSMGEGRLQEELAKCQLLCKPCHLNKTIAMLSVKHGEGLTGKKNCRCELCVLLKNSYMKELKRRKKLLVA